MAEEDDAPTDKQGDSNKKPKKKIILIALLVIGLIYIWSLFRSSGPTTTPSPDGANTTEEKSGDKSAGPGSAGKAGSGDSIDVTGISKDAYVVGIEKRIGATNQKVNELGSKIDKVDQETKKGLGELKNSMDQSFGRIIEQQTKFIADQQSGIRDGSVAPLPPLGTPGPSGVGTIPGPGNRNPALAYVSAGGTSMTSSSPLPRNLDTIAGDAKSALGLNTDTKLPPAPSTKEVKKKPTMDIPSSSTVHVTTLHGINCPMTGTSRGGGAADQSVPIILPIKGIFLAPNGASYDLGHAHLQGKCMGMPNSVRGDRARGRIFVDRLSYVSPNGKNQFITVDGYISDRRDSELDVLGYYDSVQTTALAKSAAAAGIAAVGQLSVASNFTSSTNPATGSTTSVFNGEMGRTALAAAASAAATRGAEFWQNQVEQLVPVVKLEANLPLVFQTTLPFSVEMEEGDAYASALY